MRFSQSFLDEIRDRVPISDVIGRRVAWDKRKTNTSRGDYWACCPFHGEKTPSFHCEDKKGRYHCFGCGVSGDHFRFLTELDGMAFPEAVQQVADMAGVPMPERDPEAERREARGNPDAERDQPEQELPGAPHPHHGPAAATGRIGLIHHPRERLAHSRPVSLPFPSHPRAAGLPVSRAME